MHIIHKILATTAVAALVFGFLGFVVVGKPSTHLRLCGCREDIWSRLSILRRTHCCGVLSMYNDLRVIDAGEDEYHRQHGGYSASLSDVTNFLRGPLAYTIQLRADDQQWFAAVPAQDRFPGHYLFRGGVQVPRIYFNVSRPATTNDMVLGDL